MITLISAVINDVTIIGKMPNCIAVGFHTVPKMNENTPICEIAGSPLIKINTEIKTTANTDTLAHRKNPPSEMRSPGVRASTFLLFVLSLSFFISSL